jgi:hypothetical protein
LREQHPSAEQCRRSEARLVYLEQVKTELVLKSLRDGNQGEHPRVILDTFFVPPEQGGLLDPMELER